ncbi:4Fe-4S binding protein [bacterium]|nr:4Fe-4S binding protein [bacterium]
MQLPFGIEGDRLVVRKVVTRAILPLGDTAIDLLPFLIMVGLTVLGAVLMRWKFPHRQWARRAVQTLSAVAFIMGVHPCACMTRDLILGANSLGRDDLNAFKYLVIFATVMATTMFFGRVFCGWICPLGFVQELLAKTTRWMRRLENQAAVLTIKYILGVVFLGTLFYSSYKTKPATYSFIEHIMVFFAMGLALMVLSVLTERKNDWLFKNRLRYYLLATIFGVYIYGIYANGPFCVFFTAYVEWASVISCFGVLVISIVLMNAWCRYMCPEGATLGILCSRSAWQINRNDRCTSCGCCERACPLDCITNGIRDRRTCIFCMRCVDACDANALEVVNEVWVGERQKNPYVPLCTLDRGPGIRH